MPSKESAKITITAHRETTVYFLDGATEIFIGPLVEGQMLRPESKIFPLYIYRNNEIEGDEDEPIDTVLIPRETVRMMVVKTLMEI